MDWKKQSLNYIDRIQYLSYALKDKVLNLEHDKITKETRQDMHDLEASTYGLMYALNKIEMLPQQKKTIGTCQ